MDFITHLPESVRGFDGIMTIVDRFSRLVKFVPMKTSSSAADVARMFCENWLCSFGAP